MVTLWHQIIVIFKHLTHKRFSGTLISWMDCCGRLIGPNHISWWEDVDHRRPIHPTSMDHRSGRHSADYLCSILAHQMFTIVSHWWISPSMLFLKWWALHYYMMCKKLNCNNKFRFTVLLDNGLHSIEFRYQRLPTTKDLILKPAVDHLWRNDGWTLDVWATYPLLITHNQYVRHPPIKWPFSTRSLFQSCISYWWKEVN